MKSIGHKKVLGLAITERSVMVGQVSAGERPRVEQLEEFVFPPEIWPQKPQQAGAALAEFLAKHSFTGHSAVVGVPLKWLLVRRKDVPPADSATLINMMRLQAESEFSTEIEMVYDFAGAAMTQGSVEGKSVLLMAMPKRYVDAATAMCQAAKLKIVAITPTALALGEATAQQSGRELLVLAAGPEGSEFSVQHGSTSSVIRHLRAPDPQPPFISELRRAVSTLPATLGSVQREMILWDGKGIDENSLGQQLGMTVRLGELPELGVDHSIAGQNGESNRYAPAVAVALAALAGGPTVDFLHSRLAPPKVRNIPPWTIWAGSIAAALLITFVSCYFYLGHEQDALAKLQAAIPLPDTLKKAQTFVDQVSFAQAWHAGQPKYVACLRDLTNAIPEDGQTYVTSLTIKDTPQSSYSSSGSGSGKNTGPATLTGQIIGKTSDTDRAQSLVDRMQRIDRFSDVRLDHTQDAARERQVSFLILFTYTPAAKTP